MSTRTLVEILGLVARPLRAAVKALLTDLKRGERGFIGRMAQRGYRRGRHRLDVRGLFGREG